MEINCQRQLDPRRYDLRLFVRYKWCKCTGKHCLNYYAFKVSYVKVVIISKENCKIENYICNYLFTVSRNQQTTNRFYQNNQEFMHFQGLLKTFRFRAHGNKYLLTDLNMLIKTYNVTVAFHCCVVRM